NRDAQLVAKARGIKPTHIDLSLYQPPVQLASFVPFSMRRHRNEKEIRLGWRDVKAKVLKITRKHVPLSSDDLPTDPGVSLVIQSRRTEQLGDCVHVVRVLRLGKDRPDQAFVAEPISETETR